MTVYVVSPCINVIVWSTCSKSTPAEAVCSDSSNSIVLKWTVTTPSLPFFLSRTTSAYPAPARADIAFVSWYEICPGLSSSIIVTLVLVSYPGIYSCLSGWYN